jgi:hypothetical protein
MQPPIARERRKTLRVKRLVASLSVYADDLSLSKSHINARHAESIIEKYRLRRICTSILGVETLLVCGVHHRLYMELDLQSLFGLLCTAVLIR